MNDLASLIGNADVFPVLRHWSFFNHAGVAPIPRAAADAMRKFAGASPIKFSWRASGCVLPLSDERRVSST